MREFIKIQLLMFKYDTEIKALNECDIQCPPDEIFKMVGDMYRFIHLSKCSNYTNNNIPVLKINPKRVLDNDKKCIAIASLSCFESQIDALAEYEKLKKHSKLIAKSIGCQLVRFTVSESDGFRTKSNKNGHFSFFESDRCDLKGEIIQEISEVCRK